MESPYLMEGQQCRAKSKQAGRRCKRPAIAGGTVCYIHGGAAPQVQHAARDRLRAMIHPALTAWEELLAQTEFPTVRFSTAREIVNHEFGKPAEAVTVEHSGDMTFRWKSQSEKSS